MPTTLTIGNFDGVHVGHQALLRAAQDVAPDNDIVVLTFAPHPRMFFQPDTAPFLLVNPITKTRLLQKFGAKNVVAWNFDTQLSHLSAANFLDRVVAELNPQRIVVGCDFAFGHQRTGNLETLHADKRFAVQGLPLVGDFGAISSSRIRQALQQGDIKTANQFLGWDWGIEGVVVTGDKRGRTIGFPTANFGLGDCLAPKFAVYAVRVDVAGHLYAGVANIGIRPSYPLKKPMVEVHIFDFADDIYGQSISVQPVAFLRGEQVFASLDALKAQITKDCMDARKALVL